VFTRTGIHPSDNAGAALVLAHRGGFSFVIRKMGGVSIISGSPVGERREPFRPLRIKNKCGQPKLPAKLLNRIGGVAIPHLFKDHFWRDGCLFRPQILFI